MGPRAGDGARVPPAGGAEGSGRAIRAERGDSGDERRRGRGEEKEDDRIFLFFLAVGSGNEA